ncbi:MAG TPA: hypothetical protein VJS63_11520 [Bradyrhizobium sp.]|nr:hypothetical protein [Bradyrhizobium sp.]
MNDGWKIFLLAAAIFAVAFGAERWLVPEIVPVAFAEGPQPLGSLQTAFFLRAIELMTAGVAAIALVVTLGAWVNSRPRRRAL